jgi:hypothetical protein
MSYDYAEKKTVIVLADSLAAGQALNVAGHLSISAGAWAPRDLMGRPSLTDADGGGHAGISRYPVIVTQGTARRIGMTRQEALGMSGVFVADFPECMLATGHDDELAARLAEQKSENLTYLGVLVFGPVELVSRLTRRFSLWK